MRETQASAQAGEQRAARMQDKQARSVGGSCRLIVLRGYIAPMLVLHGLRAAGAGGRVLMLRGAAAEKVCLGHVCKVVPRKWVALWRLLCRQRVPESCHISTQMQGIMHVCCMECHDRMGQAPGATGRGAAAAVAAAGTVGDTGRAVLQVALQ